MWDKLWLGRRGRRVTSRVTSLSDATRAVLEPLEHRLLLSGSISGQVWNDLNGNGTRDAGEPALPGWTVYLDQNRNHLRDGGEAWVSTGLDGSYTISGLAADVYYVAQELPIGWERTSATGLSAAVTSGTLAHGVSRPLTFTGSKAPITLEGEPVEVPVLPSDAESNSLIRLTNFRNDPRFSGMDGHGFSVAILDTGIDLNHPFFGPDLDHNGVADRIVYQHDFGNNDADASDTNGHGSNVASIAAGQDPSCSGMAPGANIIALKVFTDAGGGTFSYIEQALQWLVANADAYNLAAVNMSLGDSANFNTPQQLYGISDELAALAAKNVIVVSAAGNGYYKFQAQGVSYPAADPNSLAVGAVYDSSVGSMYYTSGAADYSTAPDRIVSFSQRSTSMVDIFAPGAIITGANATGGTSGYTGTSQASPHIAGLAVLAQQIATKYLGRRLSPAEFTSLLGSSGVSIIDGDDENDNVLNTGASFKRADALALADSIFAMASNYPDGYTVVLQSDQQWTGGDFGNRVRQLQPTALMLETASDSGISNTDLLTNLDNSSLGNRLSFRVSGTVAGTTVTLYADGKPIGSAVGIDLVTIVTTSGTSDVADGVHAITARQTAPNLPQSADSPSITLTIDTITPAAPANLDLLASSDSGISDTDNLTNSINPVFSFVASPYFQFAWNGSLVSSPYASGSSFVAFAPTDGVYSASVSAVDAAGNLSASVVLNITVDATMELPPGALQPGSLDTTFNSDGTSRIVRVGEEKLIKLLSLPDGGMMAVGNTSADYLGPANIFLARLTPAGMLDTTFGNSGFLIIPSTYRDSADDALIQSDGKIVVAGGHAWQIAGGGTTTRALLQRYNADGTADTSFGGTGSIVTNIGTGQSEWYGVEVGPGNTIVVAGDAYNSGQPVFGIARFTASGGLDSTFDSDGLVLADMATLSVACGGLAVALDGGVVVSGMVSAGSIWNVGVARFTSAGQWDTSFDGDGKAQYALPDGWDVDTFDMLLQGDGKILVAGDALNWWSTGTSMPMLLRLENNGALDSEFGNNGFVLADTLLADEIHGSYLNLQLGPDGRIFAAGSVMGRSGAPNNSVVVRYMPDGSIDTSFGVHGKSTLAVEPLGSSNYIQNVFLTGDGKLMAGGRTAPGVSPMTGDIVLLRYNLDSRISPIDLMASSDSGRSDTDNITSIARPVLQMPAVANHYYRVYRDGQLISDPWLPSNTFTAPTQPDGIANYTFQIVDAAGNASPQSQPLAVTVTTNVPATPAVPGLQAASDSGVRGDLITSVLCPTLDVVAGSYFRVFGDGVQISGDYQTGGSYTLPLQSLGVHQYTVSAVDAAGNISNPSAPLVVTFIEPVPTQPVLDSGCDSGVSSSDGITRFNNAGGQALGFAVGNTYSGSHVTLYVDGVAAGSTVAVGSAVMGGLDAGVVLADGQHLVTAAQAQVAGQSNYTLSVVGTPPSLSPPLVVTVDTIAPAAPAAPALQAASDSGIIGDLITNLRSPTFDVAAGPYFRVFGDGVQISGDYQTGGSYRLPPQLMGVHQYTVSSVDAAGNVSDPSAPLVVTFTEPVPTQPVLDSGCDSGISSSDNLTNFNNTTGRGLRFSVGNTDVGSQVTLYVDGVPLGSAVAAGGEVLVSLNAGVVLGDGQHLVTARQTLAAGGETSSSTALSLMIDTVSPATVMADMVASSDNGISNTDNITNTSTPVFTAPGATYYCLYVNNVAVSGNYTTGNYAIPAVADGSYTISAASFDAAGNTSGVSFTIPFTINTRKPATPVAPDMRSSSDSGVSPTDDITNVNVPKFTVVATPYYRFYRDGLLISSSYETGTIYSAAVQPDGTYSYSVAAADVAGNVSDFSPALVVQIDTQAPAVPPAPDLQSASDSGFSNSDNITNILTPAFTVAGAPYFRFYRNGTLLSGFYGGGSSYTPSNQPNGSYNYSIEAVDAAGNVSARGPSLVVAIDLVSPAVSRWASANDHGRGIGEVALTMPDDDTFSEPRDGGVRRVLVTCSEAIDPNSLTVASVAIAGTSATGNAVNLAGITITTSTRSGNLISVIQFDQALPDFSRYSLRVSGLKDLAGNVLTGDTSVVFTALKGDVLGDLQVNSLDLAYTRSAVADPIAPGNMAQARADLSLDGRVNAIDQARVRTYMGHDARSIASPVLHQSQLASVKRTGGAAATTTSSPKSVASAAAATRKKQAAFQWLAAIDWDVL